MVDKYRIPLYLHQQELITYRETAEWAKLYGFTIEEIPANHFFITEKDTVSFGNSTLKVALTAGHSIASLSFYNLEEKFCIAGDALFKGTIGRTDLPHGNYEILIQSIKEKMMIWDDDMRIFSGHGMPTTIGEERVSNPFLTT